MRLFTSKAAAAPAGVLCVCALLLLLAACSPQDGSAPAVATKQYGNQTGQQAAKQPVTTAPQKAAETRRINIQDTQAALAAGTALVVDVRDEATYKTSHIKGAKNIPLPQFEERIGELPKDKLIITYCA